MTIQFDASKATMFRNVDFGNENAIANLDGKDGVKANGRFTLFGKFSRTDEQRADNNAVRTALLKALGQAFGLSGMTTEGGTVKFSRDFMGRLEQILGSKVFKRGDFEVGADGVVKSGKPLTQRRITALFALKDLEEMLPKERFVRVHKSYIVSFRHIQDLDKSDVTVAGNKVPVGASYRDELLSRLQ